MLNPRSPGNPDRPRGSMASGTKGPGALIGDTEFRCSTSRLDLQERFGAAIIPWSWPIASGWNGTGRACDRRRSLRHVLDDTEEPLPGDPARANRHDAGVLSVPIQRDGTTLPPWTDRPAYRSTTVSTWGRTRRPVTAADLQAFCPNRQPAATGQRFCIGSYRLPGGSAGRDQFPPPRAAERRR
jgi:hypothetical protein